MEHDDGESGDSAAGADVARPARVECSFLRTVVVRSPPASFSAIESGTKSGDRMGVILGFCFPREGFLRRLHVRSHQDIPLQPSRDANVRRWRKEHPTR